MKIQCDHCKTEYTINPTKLPLRGGVVTCKNCGNKFRIEHPDAKIARPAAAQKGPHDAKREIPHARKRPFPGEPKPMTPAPAPGKTISPSTTEITDSEYAAFIVKNTEMYLRKFESFSDGGYAFTWHWPAFFFPLFWFLYRKLFVWAFMAFIINFIPFVNLIARFAWAITGNYLYYKNARAKITEIKKTTPSTSGPGLSDALARQGGVSNWVYLPVLLPVIGIIASVAIPNYVRYKAGPYDMKAKAHLEEAVATQEAYKEKNREYASSAEALRSVNTTFGVEEGMTFNIFPTRSDTYFMETVHESGSAKYIILGPTSKITRLTTRMDAYISQGRTFRVSAPRSWKEMPELDEEADLGIGNDIEDCYLTGYIEARENAPDRDLAQFSKETRTFFMEDFLNPDAKKMDIHSIHGNEAIQYKITGIIPDDNVKITALQTVIMGESNFYHLIGWTTSRKFPDKEDMFNYIVHRFEEI